MGDNGGSEEQNVGAETPALARRRLLQGAAAAGVGAAAWSAPNIKTLGFTPAYAQVCTVGATSYSLGQRNTNCNCNPSPGTPTPPNTVVRYKEFGNPCDPGPAFPGTAVAKEDSCAGVDLTDAGDCPIGYETQNGNIGGAGVCVTPTDPLLFCQTEVRVYQGGSCGGPFTSFFGAIAQGQNFLPLPAISCTGMGNIFIEAFTRCSTDDFCLTV